MINYATISYDDHYVGVKVDMSDTRWLRLRTREP